ncbi:MAG: penicillin-binding protein, partial [Clostridia bacterium]|nr:penicillin-binding protein [Clostridia bacterium]
MKNKRKGPSRRRGAKILRIVFLVLLTTGLLSIGGIVCWLSVTVDTEADAALFEASQGSRTTRLYYNADRTGSIYVAREWESERLVGGENAIWCPIERMPEDLKNAFLAAEDHRFYSHNGIDWVRTLKAVINQLFHFDSRFGGSGITQQLVKNITGEREVSAVRKLREGWRALALERRFSKEEILELYLNIVPMGENSIGVAAGAEQYFGKSVEELTLAECAALAAVINAPVRYDPVRHPEENAAKRNTILREMKEYGMIGEARLAEAASEELRLSSAERKSSTKVLSWYTETVIDDVLSDLCEKKGYSRATALRLLFGGGLEIYTLADPAVQRAMEDGISSVSLQEGVQYAGVVADPATGDILGIVG